MDLEAYAEVPMYTDKAKVSEVIVYKRKETLKEDAEIKLFGNRIVIDEGKEDCLRLPFEEISAVSVLGRNKLNIYHDRKIYQLKSDKRFNALKYVNMFYHYKNISKGESNEQFLGL